MSRAVGAKIIAFPAERSRGVVGIKLTKPQLAARWGVSERWIEERQKHDGLPFEKDPISRFIRYDLIAVEEWRAQRTRAQSAGRSA